MNRRSFLGRCLAGAALLLTPIKFVRAMQPAKPIAPPRDPFWRLCIRNRVTPERPFVYVHLVKERLAISQWEVCFPVAEVGPNVGPAEVQINRLNPYDPTKPRVSGIWGQFMHPLCALSNYQGRDCPVIFQKGERLQVVVKVQAPADLCMTLIGEEC